MKIMKTYIKPETVIIKMDVLPLLSGSGGYVGGAGGDGGAKRYHTILDNASPVGFPINGDDNDKKWH